PQPDGGGEYDQRRDTRLGQRHQIRSSGPHAATPRARGTESGSRVIASSAAWSASSSAATSRWAVTGTRSLKVTMVRIPRAIWMTTNAGALQASARTTPREQRATRSEDQQTNASTPNGKARVAMGS